MVGSFCSEAAWSIEFQELILMATGFCRQTGLRKHIPMSEASFDHLLQQLESWSRANNARLEFAFRTPTQEELKQKVLAGASLGAVVGFTIGGIPGAVGGAFVGGIAGVLVAHVTFKVTRKDGEVIVSF